MDFQNLPINFPNHASVLAEDAARFRRLSPDEQVMELDEMFRLYQFLRTTSGRPEAIDRLADAEEELGRERIREFVRRHA